LQYTHSAALTELLEFDACLNWLREQGL